MIARRCLIAPIASSLCHFATQLSRRRIRSIQKLLRVGRSECVVVLRVDKEKGYIDLSKRRVSSEEIAKCEEKFNKVRDARSRLFT